MTTLGEYFGLTQYPEEFINRIISYRMNIYKNKESREYFTFDEIAEKENCNADDVRKILNTTAIIWTH